LLSTVVLVSAVACGGGGASAPDTKSASSSFGSSDGAGAPSSGGDAPSSGSSGAAASSSGSGTTTTQLGDGGDLQGARLGGKVHTETESKGDGGPKSTHGQSANEPGRTVKDLQAIIGSRREEMRACYDNALPSHPGIEGDLDIKWVIDPEGNATDLAVDTSKSTILEPSVSNCIIELIKKIKFAGSAKGYETRTHYPFNFHPKKAPPAGAKK
jgi:hypothetical protein